MKRQSAVVAALTLASVTTQGCTSSEPKSEEPTVVDRHVEELIGGVPANSAKLDAIGTIGFLYTYTDCWSGETFTQYEPFCTASLISSRTVLTAKHCIDGLLTYADDTFQPVFAIGSNAANPKRTVPLIEAQGAPVDEGGFVGYGRDVAVAHLGTAVTDLKPIKFAQLTESAIGQRYGAIGYGAQNNGYVSGKRLAGSVTVNALSGRIFEIIFGSYEAFKAWYLDTYYYEDTDGGATGGGSDTGGADTGTTGGGDDIDAFLRPLYDNTYLLDGYEVYVGNGRGDAQPCFGDSGGPLIKANAQGELVAYGVTSGGIASSTLICDYGAVYAAFGTETLPFLDGAVNWQDPCNGVTTDGVCNGDVASRCTGIGEGKRRITETDCSLFGQTCVVASNAEAMCVGEGEDPVIIDDGACPDGGAGSNGGTTGGSSGGVGLDALRAKIDEIRARSQSLYVGPFAKEVR